MGQNEVRKAKKAARAAWKIEKIGRKELKRHAKAGLLPNFEEDFIQYVYSQITNPVISRRVRYLLCWYDDKANAHKASYNRFRTASYILPGIITFLGVLFAVLNTIPTWGVYCSEVGFVVTALISGIITFINHRMEHRRYYENWIRYRGSAEQIKGECILFLSRSGDYKDGSVEEIERAFVFRIEEIANKETANWKALLDESDRKRKEKPEGTDTQNPANPVNLANMGNTASQPNAANPDNAVPGSDAPKPSGQEDAAE